VLTYCVDKLKSYAIRHFTTFTCFILKTEAVCAFDTCNLFVVKSYIVKTTRNATSGLTQNESFCAVSSLHNSSAHHIVQTYVPFYTTGSPVTVTRPVTFYRPPNWTCSRAPSVLAYVGSHVAFHQSVPLSYCYRLNYASIADSVYL
jgi:hypothetical protein